MHKGFTLIEMLLYMSLLGIFMNTLVLGTYALWQNTISLEHQAVVLEDDLLTHYDEYKK